LLPFFGLQASLIAAESERKKKIAEFAQSFAHMEARLVGLSFSK